MSNRPVVLLVDDEERILRSLAMLLRDRYEVIATTDAREALAIVGRQEVHVLVSDQRMPIMRGAELLRLARQKSPNTMRILLTGYSELDAVVASVNEGEIFRFVNKPWNAAELRDTVQQAAEISRALRGAAAGAPEPDTARFAHSPQAEAILVIDDDIEVMRTVKDIVGDAQPVLWANTLDEAMTLIERHSIAVIVSELAVGRENVTALLKLLKAEHPEIVTIVLTPFQDVSVFIGLINQGQVYRLLPKPLRRGSFSMSISSGLRHHRLLKTAPMLKQTHAVEGIRQAEDPGVATRVLGFLARLRGRTGPAPAA